MRSLEKAYKYRIYPNKKQKELLSKTFGCCRFVYNHYLNRRVVLYKEKNKSLTYNQNSKDLTSLKKELTWLKEVDSTALQSSLKDLDVAYQKFFKEHSGFPKFKSKRTYRYSYKSKVVGKNIQYNVKYIKLPKLGWVKTRSKLEPQGRILNATVSQEPSGRFYVSLCCTDVETEPLEDTNKVTGIDLGLKDFAILSDGSKISNPKYLQKSLKKLAKLQKELSRKTKGGSNYNKARIKVSRMHGHVSNQRKDFLQKLTTELIRQYDVICIEDLDVKEMLQNKKLSRNISDVSWSEFVRMLSYKADWYDRKIVKVDRYFPSSQLCSYCGHRVNEAKTLSIREWTCPVCGSHHDRDINAAINIKNEGLRILEIT